MHTTFFDIRLATRSAYVCNTFLCHGTITYIYLFIISCTRTLLHKRSQAIKRAAEVVELAPAVPKEVRFNGVPSATPSSQQSHFVEFHCLPLLCSRRPWRLHRTLARSYVLGGLPSILSKSIEHVASRSYSGILENNFQNNFQNSSPSWQTQN